jgi:hypothetical protein
MTHVLCVCTYDEMIFLSFCGFVHTFLFNHGATCHENMFWYQCSTPARGIGWHRILRRFLNFVAVLEFCQWDIRYYLLRTWYSSYIPYENLCTSHEYVESVERYFHPIERIFELASIKLPLSRSVLPESRPFEVTTL